MKTGNSEPISEALKAEIAALEALPDDSIDTSDIAPVTDWSGAKRGAFYRPIKQQLSLRLDADVVAWFKDEGDGYQTRINRALREYVESHSKRA
jgi:uncharacterized protein (DUF4415 family)